MRRIFFVMFALFLMCGTVAAADVPDWQIISKDAEYGDEYIDANSIKIDVDNIIHYDMKIVLNNEGQKKFINNLPADVKDKLKNTNTIWSREEINTINQNLYNRVDYVYYFDKNEQILQGGKYTTPHWNKIEKGDSKGNDKVATIVINYFSTHKDEVLNRSGINK